MKVNEPSAAYRALAERWAPIDALLSDTVGMRRQAQKYLPQLTREPIAAYRARIADAWLKNVFLRSVRRLSGRPFSKPITLGEATSTEFIEWSGNIDMDGRNLTAFSRDILRDIISYGLAHILVDVPNTSPIAAEQNAPLTRAQEATLGVRPYFTRINPNDLIGWRSERINGIETLTQARIADSSPAPDGDFGEKTVEEIRVWQRDRIDYYRLIADDGEYVLTDSILNQLGRIPIITIYGVRDGELSAEPPLEPLAHMNLRHYRSQSFQDVSVDVSRNPLMMLLGFEEDEVSEWISGPNNAIVSSRPPGEVDAKLVEPNGGAAEIGWRDLERLEQSMEAFGNDLLMPKTGVQTATAHAIQHAESLSDLQAMVRNVESGIEEAAGVMGDWIGRQVTAEVDIYQEFGLRSADDREALIKLHSAGSLSSETLIRELQRTGLLSSDIDPLVEQERVQGFADG